MSKSKQTDCIDRLVVKASAGTGKTYNLTNYYLGCMGCSPVGWNAEERGKFPLSGKPCQPEEVIAVTFTKKAAAELKARFRSALRKQKGYEDMAERVEGSLIGTVHSVCLRLLQEYALEAGNSPVAEELSEEDGKVLFRRAVAPLMEKYAYLYGLFSKFDLEGSYSSRKNKDSYLLDFCRSLIDTARTNGLENSLVTMGELSWQKTLEQIDALAPLAKDSRAERAAMQKALLALCEEQSKEENYARKGRLSAQEKADNHGPKLSGRESKHWGMIKGLPKNSMAWKDWTRLIGSEAVEEDGPLWRFAAEAEVLGLRVFGLQEFRDDVRKLICGMFSFASEAVSAFQAAKQNAGVLDFADMERMAREALDEKNEAVRARLRGRFRVLFVDEFQDTNPIQLSIFRLLGQLIHGTPEAPGRIIYVGDDKQSIYGFRGAAAELTRSCTPEPLWKADSLKECWRSLPELCDFTNAFFSQIPSELRRKLLGEAEELRVESALKRPEKSELRESLSSGIPALQCWLTGVSKGRLSKADTFASLARNVAKLCGRLDENGGLLVNAEGNRAAKVACIAKLGDSPAPSDFGTRAIRPGDIAVLCRKNDDCVAVADALEALGIPAAAERKGLLEQEDVGLCLNAFRLVLDPNDRLAATEMHLALNGATGWIEAARQENSIEVLRQGIPFLNALDEIRPRLPLLTTSELLDEVLSAADSFRLAAARPRGEEGFACLEALRSLVREYERAMHSRRASATAQGWLDWLEEKEPSLSSGGEDAVQVWTYHKSKGLERKVVILYGLSDSLKQAEIFKPRVFSKGEALADASRDPLDDRVLEWMPDVFGKAIATDGVRPFFEEKREQASALLQEEDLRLLYVGMTRAENILVLCLNKRKKESESPLWLDTFCSTERLPFLPPKSPAKKGKKEAEEVPASLDGKQYTFCGSSFLLREHMDIEPLAAPSGERSSRFFPVKARNTAQAELETAPLNSVDANWIAFPATPVDASGINPEAPRDQLGNMLHGWFAVWFSMGKTQREEERSSGRLQARLERFCALWNQAFQLWPDAAAHLPVLSDSLEKAVESWFEGREEKRPGDELVIRTEWPLEHRLEEGAGTRLDSMRVDLMAEVRHADGTPGPCLILDHKCGNYAGKDSEELKAHLVLAYGQRQSEYLCALHAIGRKPSCWLHLPLEGKMLELTLNTNEA